SAYHSNLEIFPAMRALFTSMFYQRRLPHLQVQGRPNFITWRLHGSLPINRVFPTDDNAGKAFVAMDRILDREITGPAHLRRPEIAELVVDAFRYGQEHLGQYQLHAFVVMPNHVHILITPSVEIAKITHTLKRFTARDANRVLGLTAKPFWQDESYDHLVRNEREFN